MRGSHSLDCWMRIKQMHVIFEAAMSTCRRRNIRNSTFTCSALRGPAEPPGHALLAELESCIRCIEQLYSWLRQIGVSPTPLSHPSRTSSLLQHETWE